MFPQIRRAFWKQVQGSFCTNTGYFSHLVKLASLGGWFQKNTKKMHTGTQRLFLDQICLYYPRLNLYLPSNPPAQLKKKNLNEEMERYKDSTSNFSIHFTCGDHFASIIFLSVDICFSSKSSESELQKSQPFTPKLFSVYFLRKRAFSYNTAA